MEKRLEEVAKALNFVVTNSNCPDAETAIRDSYECNTYKRKEEGRTTKALEAAKEKHNLRYLGEVEGKVGEISNTQNELDAFGLFGQIELEFEPIEESVLALESELDAAIQLQIDIARGK
jgi:hypothetical protein